MNPAPALCGWPVSKCFGLATLEVLPEVTMDEARLIERLRAIEALYAGAATPGEKNAATLGRDRILEHLQRLQGTDPLIEYQFSMADMWMRRVFVALLRRYGIKPYRYARQRRTTVMARMPKTFLDQTLWPEYEEISTALTTYLSEATDRVIGQVLHADGSDADVLEGALELDAASPSEPGQN